MASKIFLDANVLLDITLERLGVQFANNIIRLSLSQQAELFTTLAVIHITSYFTYQYLTKELTKQAILVLLNNVRIIDCDHTTTLIALHSPIEVIEDALQYYTALKHNLDYFISSDKKLKKAALPQLTVYTAAELTVVLQH